MRKYRHIFLTGEKQTGKSTVIKKALEETKTEACGFLTLPYYINNKLSGFYMHALGSVPKGYKNDIPISAVIKEKCPIAITKVFDTFACAILKSAYDCKKVVILDELGTLEKDSTAFKDNVEKLLNSHVHVLGVIQKNDNNSWDNIKKRDDVFVFNLNEENRERAAEILKEHILKIK